MELRVLRYFLTVVREENISRAAEILHITQPTLNRQLAQLEEELGAQLFTRGWGVALTEQGMLLRRRAEELVELVELADKTEQEFLAQSQELTGVISIGSGESASAQVLPEILSSFHQKYPSICVSAVLTNNFGVKHTLPVTGDLDVYFPQLGLYRLFRVAVSVVRRCLRCLCSLAPLTSQLLVQFHFHHCLDHISEHLLHCCHDFCCAGKMLALDAFF